MADRRRPRRAGTASAGSFASAAISSQRSDGGASDASRRLRAPGSGPIGRHARLINAAVDRVTMPVLRTADMLNIRRTFSPIVEVTLVKTRTR